MNARDLQYACRRVAYMSGLSNPPAIPIGPDRVLTRTAWGNPLVCIAGDRSVSPALLLAGVYEPAVTRTFRNHFPTRPGGIVVEVGANIGFYTVLGASAC